MFLPSDKILFEKRSILMFFGILSEHLFILLEILIGTAHISDKSRELLFECLWIYYRLGNDKKNIPKTFAGVDLLLYK